MTWHIYVLLFLILHWGMVVWGCSVIYKTSQLEHIQFTCLLCKPGSSNTNYPQGSYNLLLEGRCYLPRLQKLWPVWPWPLTYWPENGKQHIICSCVFKPHMNIIHEIDNDLYSGHDMLQDRQTERWTADGWNESNILPHNFIVLEV